MKLAPISADLLIKLALAGAVIGVLIYGWRKVVDTLAGPAQAVHDLAASAIDVADQAIVNTEAAFNNNIAAPFAQGQAYGGSGQQPILTEKQVLYGDAGYTGNDPASGLPVAAGQWYSNQDALRYENEQRAAGTLPAYTSTNGAAFGVFPQIGTSIKTWLDTQLIASRGRVVGGV